MQVILQDIYIGLGAILFIALVLFITLYGIHKKWFSPQQGRRLLHTMAISACAVTIHFFTNLTLLAWVFFLFFLLLFVLVRRGFMQQGAQRSYGIALFPLAFAIVLFISFPQRYLLTHAALVLAWADAAAAWAGQQFGKNKIVFWQEAKSVQGFVAFFMIALILSFCFYPYANLFNIVFCILLAFVPAVAELFSYKGSDNLTVPLITVYWHGLLYPFVLIGNNIYILLGVIVLMVLLAVGAVYKKWLTIGGATAALWMGCIFWTTGGWLAFVAPALHLVSGSLLSKLNKKISVATESEGRSGAQVLANGMVGASCLLVGVLSDNPVWLPAALVSFAAAMSDSVSSELGRFFKGRVVNIIGLQPITPGLSGGISAMGTAAGWAAAVVLAAVTGYIYELPFFVIGIIAALGFAGMLLDSVLGSLLQAKYRLPDGSLTETPQSGAVLCNGYSWCTNDMVNILSNICMTGLAYLFFSL